MLEREVESYLVRRVLERGGVCLKLAMIGKRNFPDRTILLPGGKISFVECKAPKQNPRKTQSWFIRTVLKPLGFKVFICRSKEDVEKIINETLESL